MSGRQGWSQDARRRAATAHAKHPYYCTCGKIVHGNGGRDGHFRPDSPRPGHTELTPSAYRLMLDERTGA